MTTLFKDAIKVAVLLLLFWAFGSAMTRGRGLGAMEAILIVIGILAGVFAFIALSDMLLSQWKSTHPHEPSRLEAETRALGGKIRSRRPRGAISRRKA